MLGINLSSHSFAIDNAFSGFLNNLSKQIPIEILTFNNKTKI